MSSTKSTIVVNHQWLHFRCPRHKMEGHENKNASISERRCDVLHCTNIAHGYWFKTQELNVPGENPYPSVEFC